MSRHTRLPRLILALALSLSGIGVGQAAPRLNIEITGGVEAAQPIAIVPFGVSEGLIPPVDVAAVVECRPGPHRQIQTHADPRHAGHAEHARGRGFP